MVYESLDKSQRDLLITLLKHTKSLFRPLWEKKEVYRDLVKVIDEALEILLGIPTKSEQLNEIMNKHDINGTSSMFQVFFKFFFFQELFSSSFVF